MKKTLITLLILASLAVAAQPADLSEYPAPFVVNGLFNAKLVVGKNAATSDVIGAVDIAASLIASSKTDIALGRMNSIFKEHLAVLDVDAPPLGSQNLIVVGGPCANSVAAELMGYPVPCNKGFEPGKAVIKLYPEKKALLVAGYDAQETLAASYVLADYSDYSLKGSSLEVTIAGLDVLAINPK